MQRVVVVQCGQGRVLAADQSDNAANLLVSGIAAERQKKEVSKKREEKEEEEVYTECLWQISESPYLDIEIIKELI